jgi:iron complex transport system substrate-binding protein
LAWSGSTFPTLVSLAPNITEMVYALGAEDQLLGVTDACDYPEVAKIKPKIGSVGRSAIERIIALNPDYAIGSGGGFSGLDKLRLFDIEHLDYTIDSVDEFYVAFKALGVILGKSKEADKAITNIKRELKVISRSMIAVNEKPSLLILLWHQPLIGVGQHNFVDNLIELAGFENIVLGKGYPQLNTEVLLLGDPDFILLNGEASATAIKRSKQYSLLSAVNNKQVLNHLDMDLILRPGPRFVDGIRLLRDLY